MRFNFCSLETNVIKKIFYLFLVNKYYCFIKLYRKNFSRLYKDEKNYYFYTKRFHFYI